MFLKVVKDRLISSVAMLLVFVLIFQCAPTAYADNNGNNDSGSSIAISGSFFDWWGDATMVIMLTTDENFILTY